MGLDAAKDDVLEGVLGELASLRAENERLAARVDALDGQSSGHQNRLEAGTAHQRGTGDDDARDTAPGLSRRRLLTRLAGAGAVGAGVLAVGDTFGPRAAQAAAGGNFILGQVNDAGTALTQLTSTSPEETLAVFANAPVSDYRPSAILGDSNGTGLEGAGVLYGVVASGDLAPLWLQPNAGVVGPPTIDTHRVGEVWVDAHGGLFQCVGAGTPGTWVRVGFNPLNPTRILDTRTSSPVGQNSSVNLAVGGHFGVPNLTPAIVVNATVTQGTASSFLTIYPKGISRPAASNLNWVPGQTVPNLVTVKLSTSGEITIYNAKGTVDVVLDLAGFYS